MQLSAMFRQHVQHRHRPQQQQLQVGHQQQQHQVAARRRVDTHKHAKQRRISTCSVWDDSMTLADLRQQLDAAVSKEDYSLAAQLRDTLQKRQTDARLAIEDANTRFYDAFRSGNVKEMDAVWGQGDHVQVIHPGAPCIAGRRLVMDSWAAILKGIRPNAFKIHVEDVRVFALSDSHGLVTCVEAMDADDARGMTIATNIFELQGEKWVITHHHGSPVARFR